MPFGQRGGFQPRGGGGFGGGGGFNHGFGRGGDRGGFSRGGFRGGFNNSNNNFNARGGGGGFSRPVQQQPFRSSSSGFQQRGGGGGGFQRGFQQRGGFQRGGRGAGFTPRPPQQRFDSNSNNTNSTGAGFDQGRVPQRRTRSAATSVGPSRPPRTSNNNDDETKNNNSAVAVNATPKPVKFKPPEHQHNDDFETTVEALADVFPAIESVRRVVGWRKKRLQQQNNRFQQQQQQSASEDESKFVIYDPYYCNGSVAKRWLEDFGVECINQPRDFYDDIRRMRGEPTAVELKELEQKQQQESEEKKARQAQHLPQHQPAKQPTVVVGADPNLVLDTRPGAFPIRHDMVVTNPPFSGDHIEKLFEFLLSRLDTPFAVLIPDYVPQKPYFKALFQKAFGSKTAAPTTSKNAPTPAETSKAVAAAAGTNGTLSSLFSSHPAFAATAAASASAATTRTASTSKSKKQQQKQQQQNNNSKKNDTEKSSAAVATSSSLSDASAAGIYEPFFIVPNPQRPYEFDHPIRAGRAMSHFRSLWCVWAGRATPEVLRDVQCRGGGVTELLLDLNNNSRTGTAAASSSAVHDGTTTTTTVAGLSEQAAAIVKTPFSGQLFSSLEKLLGFIARLKLKAKQTSE